MIFNEVHGDLFNAPQGCYLAHCISGDYALGAGIAKKFTEVYDTIITITKIIISTEIFRLDFLFFVPSLISKPNR